MKFVYLGNFSRSYRTEVWVADALEELGNEVIRVNNGEGALNALKEENPDVFLYSKANKVLNLRVLQNYCRKNGILSVCWIYDLYWGLPRRYTIRDAIFDADVVCSTDGGHKDKWEENGINHYTIRQGIREPEAYLGEPYETDTEIVFVGRNNPWWPERKMLMKHLESTYQGKFEWLGRDKQIRGDDLNNLFASVKIVVGDSVYSPYYWSNRVYETLGRGGFLLHPRVPGLEEEFEYYKHFIPYDLNNHEQVENIIDYYLEHDEERDKIRLAGHEFCRENYTYKDRCKKLIKIINEERGSIKRGNREHGDQSVYAGTEGEVSPEEEHSGGESESGVGDRGDSGPGKGEKEVSGVSERATAILLNYSRPENYERLIESLRGQKGVDIDIWIWDSGHNLPELEGVKIFSDPVNPGIFIRWELARFVKEGYVLFIDDDVLPLDDRVLIDTINAQKEYGEDAVVGWKGVRIKGGHNESHHVHSKHVKNDYGVHFCKGNYMLFNPENLHKTKPFPREILEIDKKAHGEFWYQLQMGNCKPNHKVIKCLEGRLTNEYHGRKGLEFRGDHYQKQARHLKYCQDKLCS